MPPSPVLRMEMEGYSVARHQFPSFPPVQKNILLAGIFRDQKAESSPVQLNPTHNSRLLR